MLKNQQGNPEKPGLSRREREMMEIIYRLGQAGVAEVLEGMAEPPSYSAVRSTLNILKKKGHLTHRLEGNRYVYRPTVDARAARLSALDHLLQTFFDGSAEDAVTALIEDGAEKLSSHQLDRLSKLIQQARREGR